MTDVARRALEARHILDHPLVKEAFDSLADEFHKGWISIPMEHTAKAERLRMMAKLLESVKRHFELIIEEGDHQKRVDEERRMAEQFQKMNYNSFDDEVARDSKTEADYIKEYREMNPNDR